MNKKRSLLVLELLMVYGRVVMVEEIGCVMCVQAGRIDWREYSIERIMEDSNNNNVVM